MGQGEPLMNHKNVFKAIQLMTDPQGLGISPKRITLSTSGVAPLIEKVGSELKCGLAISLHASTNALRDVLVVGKLPTISPSTNNIQLKYYWNHVKSIYHTCHNL